MSKAVENLLKAQEFAMSIRPEVGGFPYLAEVLRKAGIKQNIWNLPSCQSVYLTVYGPVVSQATPLINSPVDIPSFNREALIQALRTDQAGKSTFPEFLKAAWEAGVQNYGANMHNIIQQKKKYFIGLELRTNNAECSHTMPAHKNKFFGENIPSKIPNKVNGNILALYTDYEGDYTKPYSWILGCEVSNLDEVPEGLVGKEISESKYAIFTTQGKFPQGLIAVWQEIWQSGLSRAYTSDFEEYPQNFDPEQNPEVKVYIAIE